MSDGDYAEAVHYLAAIRMALEGAGNDESALQIIDTILTAGPQAAGEDLWPTRILVDAIRANGALVALPSTISGDPA